MNTDLGSEALGRGVPGDPAGQPRRPSVDPGDWEAREDHSHSRAGRRQKRRGSDHPPAGKRRRGGIKGPAP